MPLSFEEMRALEKTHICAVCEGELLTIWDAEGDCHRLCCGVDHTHNGVKRRSTTSELLARGELDEVAGKGAQASLEKLAREHPERFTLLAKKDIQTTKELTLEQLGGLVSFAESVGLNAYLGHVCFYYSKPYISIDGYYYLNNQRENPYRIGTRPMAQWEKTAYSVGDEDIAFIAEAWLDMEKLPTIGIGIVTQEEIEGKSVRQPEQYRAPVVHSHPQRMAEKRAEWQLLRKLIPLEVQESPR